jgi:hypothetical protein
MNKILWTPGVTLEGSTCLIEGRNDWKSSNLDVDDDDDDDDLYEKLMLFFF